MSDHSREPAGSVDVIVVGGGGAGLAASIEAAKAGCSVLILEKGAEIGGSTGRAVGAVAASGTALQRRAGIVDSPRDYFEDLGTYAGEREPYDNLELRHLLTDNATDTLAWLQQLGIVLYGPMPDPLSRMPRLHAVLPRSWAYIHHLSREARRNGARIACNARVERLMVEGSGVCGVEVTIDGIPRKVRAARAVILTTGDYSNGREFKRRYLDPDIADIDGITVSNTGDGHRMAAEIGAEIINGNMIWGPDIRFVARRSSLVEWIPPFTFLGRLMRIALEHLPSAILRPLLMMFVTTNLAPSPKLFEEGAILINNAGRRFTDERGRPQPAIAQQPDRLAYIVFDRRIAQKFSSWPYYISTAPGLAYAYLADYRRNRRDVFHQANTIRDLAASIGVDADMLEKTIDGFNTSCPDGLQPIVSPPFYALGPARGCIPITDGGLKVNSRLEVLDGDGKPIEGLFAAGSVGQGGLLLAAPATHLTWAFTSGRIAGRNAARR